MTPEQIKRKYQDMLNNEILAGPDPISWMHDDSEFIVMMGWTAPRTASACQDGRCRNPI
jgi:hypothetical protein